MELAVREAKARLSELIAAAEKGERVVITRHGVPAVELVRCRRRGGIDFDKLEETRRRLGIEGDGEVRQANWCSAAGESPAGRRRSATTSTPSHGPPLARAGVKR